MGRSPLAWRSQSGWKGNSHCYRATGLHPSPWETGRAGTLRLTWQVLRAERCVTVSIDEAYAICRQIARREAKNFYYAFVALPKAKRNAICAVYAFMRHADDLSDDETK